MSPRSHRKQKTTISVNLAPSPDAYPMQLHPRIKMLFPVDEVPMAHGIPEAAKNSKIMFLMQVKDTSTSIVVSIKNQNVIKASKYVSCNSLFLVTNLGIDTIWYNLVL